MFYPGAKNRLKSWFSLYFDNKKDPVGLYCYRPTRSNFMFGHLFCWLGNLPLNRIFQFSLQHLYYFASAIFIALWAAAKRAIGTLKGEQDT